MNSPGPHPFHNRLTVVLAALLWVLAPVFGNPLPTSAQPPPAEYGDAPDGTPALYPGPLFAVPGNFPTLFNPTAAGPGRPGAHHLTSDEEWLGPFFPGAPTGPPSVEEDADDPADPDGITNLVNADAFDGGMELFVNLVSIPPPATLSFSVTVPPGAPDVQRFVNALIDLNLNGSWGGTGAAGEPEWVVQNMPVSVAPGSTQTFISPQFAFASGFVLPFPSWVRLTLTREPINPGALGPEGWDGSAPPGGFDFGETEDYYLPPGGVIFGRPSKPILSVSCPRTVNIPSNDPVGANFRCLVKNTGGPIAAAGPGAAVPPCGAGQANVSFTILVNPADVIVAPNPDCVPVGPPVPPPRAVRPVFNAVDNDVEMDRDRATVTVAPPDPPVRVIAEPIPVPMEFTEISREITLSFTDFLGEPVTEYVPNDDLYLEVSDPNENEDPQAQDEITAQVVNERNSVSQSVSLVETDVDTGLFFSEGFPAEMFNAQPGDTLVAQYKDRSAAATIGPTETPEPVAFGFVDVEGRPRDTYSPADFIFLQAGDPGENRDPEVQEEVSASLANVSRDITLMVVLVETSPDSGTFRSEGVSPEAIEAQAGDMVRALYKDQAITTLITGDALERSTDWTVTAQADSADSEFPSPRVTLGSRPEPRLTIDPQQAAVAVGEEVQVNATLELGDTGLRLLGATVFAQVDDGSVASVEPPEAMANAEGEIQFFITGVQEGSTEVRLETGELDAVLPVTVGSGGTPNGGDRELGNISTRAFVQTGDNIMIGGFIVLESEVEVMVRALGPSLPVPSPLANPSLELTRLDGTLLAANDDWIDSPDADAIRDATFLGDSLQPSNSLESAVLITLEPGGYTPQVRGIAGQGVALVEVFQVGGSGRLGNISTRAFVQTGDNIMIGGFIVLKSQVQVMVRAVGPSLPVSSPLANPSLELRRLNGTLLAANDDWVDSPDADVIRDATFLGDSLQPSNPLESAILITLGPGAYTPQVRGIAGQGVALVEIFKVDAP